MNSLLLPSRNEATPEQAEKFKGLTEKLRQRFLPETSEEYALCDQMIIASWHFRTHKAQCGRLERQCFLPVMRFECIHRGEMRAHSVQISVETRINIVRVYGSQ